MRTMERLFRHVRRRYRAATGPTRGANVCVDLSSVMRPRTIFDVGANIGQSAATFVRYFPAARIYCFEPSAISADRLRSRSLRNVEVHEMGLGSAVARASLTSGTDSATFRIAEGGDEEVSMMTVDAFCAEHGITRIDFLKIDTEGHDLEVLRGAEAMLESGRIAAVQVEAGLNPENKLHVPFEALKRFLEEHGYRMFGLYDQVNEWPTKQPHLRRANPVFVSGEVYGKNR